MEVLIDDVIQNISLFLPLFDFINFSLTCKRIRNLNTERIWKGLCEKDFNLKQGNETEYKKYYRYTTFLCRLNRFPDPKDANSWEKSRDILYLEKKGEFILEVVILEHDILRLKSGFSLRRTIINTVREICSGNPETNKDDCKFALYMMVYFRYPQFEELFKGVKYYCSSREIILWLMERFRMKMLPSEKRILEEKNINKIMDEYIKSGNGRKIVMGKIDT